MFSRFRPAEITRTNWKNEIATKIRSLSNFVGINNYNVPSICPSLAHGTQAFPVAISAKDTEGSVDKWGQTDRRRLIALEERNANEICQAMTRQDSRSGRGAADSEERFRFKIERVFNVTTTKCVAAGRSQKTNHAVNSASYFSPSRLAFLLALLRPLARFISTPSRRSPSSTGQ